MSEPKIKVGVIGLGRMGEYHLKKYLNRPDAEVVGFFETNPERAKEISERYGVPSIPSIEILLYEVDAVTIATPTASHYALTKKALESGVHVLVEKPIADSEQEAKDLAAIASLHEVQLHVGMVERFRVLALLKDLPPQKPKLIQCYRLNTSVGREADRIDVVSDLTIHDIDLALFLASSKVVSRSHSSTVVATQKADEIEARLTFKSGASATLSTSRVAFSQRRLLRLVGEGFLYELDLATNVVKGFSRSPEGLVQEFNFEKKNLDALNDEISAFLGAIRGEEVAYVTALEAAEVLSVVNSLQAVSPPLSTPKRKARPVI